MSGLLGVVLLAGAAPLREERALPLNRFPHLRATDADTFYAMPRQWGDYYIDRH
jgi:hypothetical protein